MHSSVNDDSRASAYLRDGVVALVGSPNSGKTTLFNWLTGSKFKTVNYPGATVDYSIGSTNERYGGEPVWIMDTPGTYSLDPKSPDERVTVEAIFNHRDFGAARVVVSIADATHLSRQLLVTKQLQEAGFHVILAVTMADLLKEQGSELDAKALGQALGLTVVMIDGRLGGGIAELIQTIRSELVQVSKELLAETRVHAARKDAWHGDKLEQVLRETARLQNDVIAAVAQATHQIEKPKKTARERSREIDRVLLHPVWGLAIFIVLMVGLFSSIFWLAKPVMDMVDQSFTYAGDHLLALSPQSLFLQFLSNGVIASVSSVMVFVPQIFILFLGIVVLEDSGYLARSATLVDRPLARIGMGGRSFVPLLSGYACAVPAMLAARAINSKRERWLTLFILPLMSCSARLPVYALLLSFLFHGQASWKAGVTLAVIYFASLFVGGIAAVIAGQFLKIDDKSFFIMELPVYRKPMPKLVLRQAFTRTMNYIKRAGFPIFTFALILWVATTFPNFREPNASARLSSSYAAHAGHFIEPVFKPMGGDWRTGVGLLSAFAAREVFVSSLAVVFQVSDGSTPTDESSMQENLIQKMQNAAGPYGYPLFTLASVLGLVVFFMIALQCLSTVVIAFKESGGWRFAIVQLVVFNVVAYVLAVSLVQGLRACGIA